MRFAVLDVGSNTIHLALVDMQGNRRGSHKPGCLLHKRDGRSTALVLLGDRDSNRADDKITFVGGGNELPLWGPGARGNSPGWTCCGPGHPGRGPALEIGPWLPTALLSRFLDRRHRNGAGPG